MILFELKCTNEHHYEARFKDGGAFDRQAKGGKVECPVCLDTSVVKAPMAPAVSTSSRKNSNKQQGEHRAKEVAPDHFDHQRLSLGSVEHALPEGLC